MTTAVDFIRLEDEETVTGTPAEDETQAQDEGGVPADDDQSEGGETSEEAGEENKEEDNA